jgi:peptidoglycan/LPS O-acetylase OafA/YrhL
VSFQAPASELLVRKSAGFQVDLAESATEPVDPAGEFAVNHAGQCPTPDSTTSIALPASCTSARFPFQMPKERDEVLDLVRGLSALLVLLAHVRGFVLLDLAELDAAGIVTKAFYFATGVHHQAVMVFFVLSGYFVGGSVLETLNKGRFSTQHYVLARLSRLWVALVPALLLTLAFDLAGRSSNPEAYAGALRSCFMSGPEPGNSADLSAQTFCGNLFFLQTISMPVFGSNGPLWSLANEFWYYVLFPLAALGFRYFRSCRGRPGNPGMGLALSAAFAFLVWWLPWGLVSKALIWLLGVGVWWVSKQAQAEPIIRSLGWRSITALGFVATLAASKTTSFLGSDFSVGIAFALWMPSLLGGWSKPGWWSGLGTGLSAISYTLYVSHFPFLFFIAATRLHGRQFAPNPQGLLCFAALSTASLLLATGMWWLFERNTDSVRRRVGKLFITGSR